MDDSEITGITIRFNKSMPYQGIHIQGILDDFPESFNLMVLQMVYDLGESLVFMGFGTALFCQVGQETDGFFLQWTFGM